VRGGGYGARRKRPAATRVRGDKRLTQTWIESFRKRSGPGPRRCRTAPIDACRVARSSDWRSCWLACPPGDFRPMRRSEGFHLLFFVGFMGHSAIKLVAAFTPRASTATPPLPTRPARLHDHRSALSRGGGGGGTGRQPVAAGLSARPPAGADRSGSQDHETQAAFGALDLPAGFQVLIAPPGSPQTKPRACNIALERAHGELVVIYDAEDAPHPGQLREAAARFAQATRTWPACRRRCGSSPIPASCPTSSPSNTPCCSRSSCRPWRAGACPFPLGGTSNHFRADALRAVGGWDPYNVTEDADIGFRLAARGLSAGRHHPPDLETAPAG
jgi:hypothetical protein